jgi:hypothetical protein
MTTKDFLIRQLMEARDDTDPENSEYDICWNNGWEQAFNRAIEIVRAQQGE